MSFNLLPFDNDDSIREFPPITRIPNTLILIETMKNLSMNSFGWNDNQELQQPINHYETNSFEISLECEKKSSASRPESVKKKTGCTCKKTKCLKRYC